MKTAILAVGSILICWFALNWYVSINQQLKVIETRLNAVQMMVSEKYVPGVKTRDIKLQEKKQ